MPRPTKKAPKPKGDKPILEGEIPQTPLAPEGAPELAPAETATATATMELEPPAAPAPAPVADAAMDQAQPPEELKPRPERRGDRQKGRRERPERAEKSDVSQPDGTSAPVLSVNIAKLQAMSMAELNHMAKELGIENFGTMR